MAQRFWRIAHSECSLGWGGQEHRILAELVGFQKRGSRVWLLAPTESQVYQRAQQANMPALPLDVAKYRFPFNAFLLAHWLRRERIEILNSHSSRDGWLLGIAGRLARVPLLIRSRHIDVDYPNRWISRHAFTTLADHVITTSSKITGKFQNLFGLPASRISTVPTGVDLKRFHPNGPKARLPLPEETAGLPLIGMVSVLRSWKGHPIFFKAVRILNHAGVRAHFVVVGGGAPVEYFENLAREEGVRAHVTFTGHREDVPEILRALSLLVIPSTRHEGVPQIGLQALACRTPVIASDAAFRRSSATARPVAFSPRMTAQASLRRFKRLSISRRKPTEWLNAAGRWWRRNTVSTPCWTKWTRSTAATCRRQFEKIPRALQTTM